MRNRYEGSCYLCNHLVEPNAGHFERHKGSWRVRHAKVPGFGRVTCTMVNHPAALYLARVNRKPVRP